MHKFLSCLLLVCATLASAETYKIAAVSMATSGPYWDCVHAGVQKAVREFKAQGVQIDLIWTGPENEGQLGRQIEIVREMIQQKVNGIVIAPCDSVALSSPVQAAVQAKIPVVVIDSGLKASGQLCLISTDNYKGGVLGARRLASLMEGKGNAILFRNRKGAGSTEQRERGFLDTIKSQYPDIHVISSDQYSGGDTKSAEKTALDLIASLGARTDGVFASNEVSNHGMLYALRQKAFAGGKIKFVGFDTNSEIIEALKSGDMQGTVAQNPINMGYLGVKTLVSHLQGKATEGEIDTGCVVVTPDNMINPMVAELIRKPVLE
ncbi:MAG: substrate-binding domain-containing protein [Opitutaceae bacterium]|jgi:ribose transport system substrate-binding protein